MNFKSFLRRNWFTSEMSRPPAKNEHALITDSILSELEFHMRDLERYYREQEVDERRRKNAVDYSWLVSTPPKLYEIPHLEKLELEELCYKVTPSESSKVIALFRDSVLREPPVPELPRIMRSCIHQILEQRPKPETLTEWVTKRTLSLTSLKLRQHARVAPSLEAEDIEMQVEEVAPRENRALSMPDFTVTSEYGT